MITAIIAQEYNELCSLVSNMTYEEAFKKLNGYNLTADPITIVSYKHISTTIFRTDENGCEVWEEFDVHLSMGTDGVELF